MPVEHAGHGELSGGAGDGRGSNGMPARDLQHRSGLPVHVSRMDRSAERDGGPAQHGRERVLAGQYRGGAVLVVAEARGRLPAGLRDRPRLGIRRYGVHRALQHEAAAPGARRNHTADGLRGKTGECRIIAPPPRGGGREGNRQETNLAGDRIHNYLSLVLGSEKGSTNPWFRKGVYRCVSII